MRVPRAGGGTAAGSFHKSASVRSPPRKSLPGRRAAGRKRGAPRTSIRIGTARSHSCSRFRPEASGGDPPESTRARAPQASISSAELLRPHVPGYVEGRSDPVNLALRRTPRPHPSRPDATLHEPAQVHGREHNEFWRSPQEPVRVAALLGVDGTDVHDGETS